MSKVMVSTKVIYVERATYNYRESRYKRRRIRVCRVRLIYYIHYKITNNSIRIDLRGLARRKFNILTSKTTSLAVQLIVSSWFPYVDS